MSALMLVISRSASSNDQRSACKLAISFQISWVLTVRSPVSVPRDWVQISETFVVESFECGKVCALANRNGVSEDLLGACEPCWAQVCLSMLISGVSANSALLTSGRMLCPHVGS